MENLWLIRLADSPLGFIDLMFSTKGLCTLNIVDAQKDSPFLLPGLLHGTVDVTPEELLRGVELTIEEIHKYLQGEVTDFSRVPLDLRGTPFQLLVWRELRRISWGTTITYGELARLVKKPQAARAVARACSANPVPLIVPCHRVIAWNGGLGGYSAGLDRKRWLLEHERLRRGPMLGKKASRRLEH